VTRHIRLPVGAGFESYGARQAQARVGLATFL